MKDFFKHNPVKFSELGKVEGIPENTFESIDAAFLNGADVITLYFRLSSDMRLVSVPEAMLTGYTGNDLKVSDIPADELTALDAAYMLKPDEEFPYRDKGFRFFTLEELLGRYPGRLFNISLMDNNNSAAAVLADVIRKNKSEESIIISSNYSGVIKKVRRALPEAATSFSMTEVVAYYALFRTGLLLFRKKFPGDAIITTEFLGTSHIANQGLITSALERNIHVFVKGISSSKQAESLKLSGVDGFITENLSYLDMI